MRPNLLNQHITEAGFAVLFHPEKADPEEIRVLKQHLSECEQCNFEFLELKDLHDEVLEVEVQSQQWTSMLLKVAAIAILAIGSYFTVFTTDQSSLFLANANYENMIGDELRSTLILSTPESESTMGDFISFEFQADADQQVEVIIVDNKDNIRIRKYPKNGKLRIKRSELSDGLYYWKIETTEELLKVGKLIVN